MRAPSRDRHPTWDSNLNWKRSALLSTAEAACQDLPSTPRNHLPSISISLNMGRLGIKLWHCHHHTVREKILCKYKTLSQHKGCCLAPSYTGEKSHTDTQKKQKKSRTKQTKNTQHRGCCCCCLLASLYLSTPCLEAATSHWKSQWHLTTLIRIAAQTFDPSVGSLGLRCRKGKSDFSCNLGTGQSDTEYCSEVSCVGQPA